MNRPRLLAYSAALSALCGAAFTVVYVLTVRTRPGRQFGDASLRGAQLTESGVAGVVDSVLGFVSVATLLAGIAAIALLALTRLQRVPGVVAAGLVVAANASTWLLKNYLLERPDLGLSEVTPATHNSLPSGHTTAVFSVAVALLFVVSARWRAPLALIGGAASVVMGVSTMSAGWHRAGDSIAAFALVGLWAGLAVIVIAVLDPKHVGPEDVDPENLAPQRTTIEPTRASRWSRRWLIGLPVGSAGLAVLLALGLVLLRSLRTSIVGSLSAFVAGALLILSAAMVVLIGVQLVLARTAR